MAAEWRVEPGDDGVARCWWCLGAPELIAYHDREWGHPTRGESELYELLTLESFQSGLAWLTILRKRAGFREAFAEFDPERVASFGAAEVRRLLADEGIVRHRGKVEAAIANARAVVELRSGEGLAELLWSFAPERRARRPASGHELPSVTPESKAMARELKGRGFAFVGPTTAYSLMQASGIVDDHLAGCRTAPG